MRDRRTDGRTDEQRDSLRIHMKFINLIDFFTDKFDLLSFYIKELNVFKLKAIYLKSENT